MEKLLRTMMLFALGASLAACQQIGEGGRKAAVDSEKALKETKTALERVFTYYPEKEEYKPIPYAFCYRVMQDINCYDRPIPDARGRLVGWQGRDGSYIKAGTDVPSEASSVKQMPDNVITPKSTTKMAAVSRPSAELKPLQPVMVGNPPEVKEDHVKINISNSSSGDALY